MFRIIPAPKYSRELRGSFDLTGAAVYTDGATPRIVRAASVLCREIEIITGQLVPLSCGSPEGRRIVVSVSEGEGEGYRMATHGDAIEISACEAGTFYAIQTLRQLVKENGATLPRFEIDDEPEFAFRGFYQDVSRGRVPTLGKLKEIADTLSYFKMNSLQLYIEDAFAFRELEGLVDGDSRLEPWEISELEEYCHERFIELIPSLSTFGHMFTLLQSGKYNYLSELGPHEMEMDYWMERQWHHTIDPYEPDSIKVVGSMIEQYMPLHRSEFFNICCDETMDLCRGKNAGRDKGEAFFSHADRLFDLIKSHGKRVMMWGDEVMARSELAKEHVPKDAVILNWCYRKEVNEWIPKFFSELGFEQICCPGVSSWDNFIEDADVGEGNITSFAAHAKKYGALGILNTSWGDFGHVCNFNCALYGLALGAERSWNVSSSLDEDYELAASALLYGVTELNMANLIKQLSTASKTCSWSRFVMWKSDVTHGKTGAELSFGECLNEGDAIANIDICKNVMERLSPLERSDAVITDIILAARALILMTRLFLAARGVAGYDGYEALGKLQDGFDEWLPEYSAAWLRADKPSGLPRLQEYIKHITEF
ncbi:MAG: family 20 glycosylhydrolase [Clostridia bacterium]|nr:family 20 glycosylhydrolase [Clostridia bacterium]